MSYPQELAVMGWEGALNMWEMWKERGDRERRKDREGERRKNREWRIGCSVGEVFDSHRKTWVWVPSTHMKKN